jgi:hypothetical protein
VTEIDVFYRACTFSPHMQQEIKDPNRQGQSHSPEACITYVEYTLVLTLSRIISPKQAFTNRDVYYKALQRSRINTGHYLALYSTASFSNAETCEVEQLSTF